MAREYGDKRKKSTIWRDNQVHKINREVRAEIGMYAPYVPKSVIYEKIRTRTGLCLKTIATILNHTVAEE